MVADLGQLCGVGAVFVCAVVMLRPGLFGAEGCFCFDATIATALSLEGPSMRCGHFLLFVFAARISNFCFCYCCSC